MSSEVSIPQVPRRVVVISSICWLALTALSALLVEQKGFAAEMTKQLLATAATAAFGISGFAVLVQVWQRRESLREKVQENDQPFLAAIDKAAKACGTAASIYASAGSAVLRCPSTFDAESASILLKPPLLWDQADVATFYGWAQTAHQHISEITISGRAADPEAAAIDDQFVSRIRAASEDLRKADDELQREIGVLVKFQVSGAADVLKAASGIHSAVLDQSAGLGSNDQEALTASWQSCGTILMSVSDLAKGLDECWRSVTRTAKSRSPLEKDGRTTEVDLGMSTKTWVLVETRMRRLNEVSNRLQVLTERQQKTPDDMNDALKTELEDMKRRRTQENLATTAGEGAAPPPQ